MGDRVSAWLVFLGAIIAVLLVVVIVVVIDGDDEAGPVATTVVGSDTTAAPVTSVTPETTVLSATTAAPATTNAPGTSAAPTTFASACAGLIPDTIPPLATDRTSVIGDMDGDGALDAVTVFQDGGTWFVFVELSHGYATRAVVAPFGGFGEPQATSVMNVGVVEELALVNTGFGLVGPVYGVWYLDANCGLSQATLDGAAPFEPYKGIGLFHSEGFSCISDGIKLVNAAQPGSDEAIWQVEEITLAWMPGVGDFQTQGSSTYLTDRDSAIAAAADTGC